MDEWRQSPKNPRNTPKLSPEENQRIIDEALAHDHKWEVQEKINARRQAETQAKCGGSLGKTLAPAKFDAMVPTPRCQAGAGAFGTYFVHSSEKYGIKLFRDSDPDIGMAEWEFDRLSKAHAAGVNVPEPLAINSSTSADGYSRETLTLRHMQGYKEISDVYSNGGYNLGNAPLIIKVKALREFRKLHLEGLAHGDIHGGNILANDRSKRIALVDFGYSTQIDDAPHVAHNRDGVENIMYDLDRLPDFVGLNSTDFQKRYSGVFNNVEAQARDYNKSWDKYELAINRFHDLIETELLWDDRKPRSRFVSGADQPRIPGLTRRILTANANTFQRQVMEQVNMNDPTLFRQGAKNMGLKPANLFMALKPERQARLAAQRKKPFGTPVATT